MDATLMIIATLIPFAFAGGVLGITGMAKAGRQRSARRLGRRLAAKGIGGVGPPRLGTDGVEPETWLRVVGGDDITDMLGVAGRWRGYPVELIVESVVENNAHVQVRVARMRLPVDWAGGACIRPAWSFGDGEIPVELPADAFANPVRAWGDRAAVIAILTADVRPHIVADVSIRDGDARLRMRSLGLSADALASAFDTLAALCDAVPRCSQSESLEAIVLGDPWPSMRGAAFDALRSARSGLRSAFVDQALASPLVDVRARGAAQRGQAAVDTAVEVLLDDMAAPGPRAHVAKVAATYASSDRVAAAVARGIEHDGVDRADEWLAAALALDPGHRGPVARALHARIDRDVDVRPAHFAAAAVLGDDAWYPVLVKGFDEAEDAVILAALAAVAETAALSRVEHLKHYAGESTGIAAGVRVDRPWSRKLKRAADAAVARIQERRGGAAGGLAIADHAEGALATVDEP